MRIERYLQKSAGWLDSGHVYTGSRNDVGELVIDRTHGKHSQSFTIPNSEGMISTAAGKWTPSEVRAAIHKAAPAKIYEGVDAPESAKKMMSVIDFVEKHEPLKDLYSHTILSSGITGAKRGAAGGAAIGAGILGMGVRNAVAKRRAADIAKKLETAKLLRNKRMLIGGGAALGVGALAGLTGLGVAAHHYINQ